MAELVFQTTLQELLVKIDGADFTLRELDGLTKGKYLNKMGSRIVLNDQGKVAGFKDYGGLETTLLGLCLYDAEGKLVPIPVMDKWPSNVLSKLFDAAQDLSALNEEARKRVEGEAKNS